MLLRRSLIKRGGPLLFRDARDGGLDGPAVFIQRLADHMVLLGPRPAEREVESVDRLAGKAHTVSAVGVVVYHVRHDELDEIQREDLLQIWHRLLDDGVFHLEAVLAVFVLRHAGSSLYSVNAADYAAEQPSMCRAAAFHAPQEGHCGKYSVSGTPQAWQRYFTNDAHSEANAF